MPALVEGEGKPLLMLHGYLSCKESFIYQIEYFKSFRRVIVPDMVGFNGTVMPYPYSLEDYARDISALIAETGKTDIIAHSFGARVLFKLLPNELADKIVLTGSAGIKPRFSLKKWVNIRRYKLRKKLGLGVEKFGSSDYKALPPVMQRSFVKIVNEKLEKKIAAVENKTLLIFGENDRETPLYMAKKQARLIKNSQLAIIKGAGHFAFIDKKNEFNILVKEFLYS